jgi:hypothetical protein
MSEEAQQLDRRAAYAQTLLSLHRRTRNGGYVVCLTGVLLLVASRYAWRWPMWTSWGAVGVIAVGWAMFVFVILKRAAWARAHPLDGDG